MTSRPVGRARRVMTATHVTPWQRRTNVWREVTSPARGFRRLTSDRQHSALPVFHRPLAARVERKPNMSWHHPDLYFFSACLQVSRRSWRSLRMHPEILQAEKV